MNPEMRRLLPRPQRLALFVRRFAMILLAAGAMAVGCKTETTEIPGKECVGGFVRPETGECEALCDDTKCKEGNRCVDNRCSLLCETQRDCAAQPVCDDEGKCYLESFRCAAAVTDTNEEPVHACVSNGARYSPVAAGYECPLGWWQCLDSYCPYDPALGKALRCDIYACNNNPDSCMPSANDPNVGTCAGSGDPCVPRNCDASVCKPSLFCPDGLQCDPFACGGNPGACKKTCAGENCNVGECEGSGEPCIFSTCELTACKGMTCISAGEGDADAYCATVDCATVDETGVLSPDDARCGGGYFCSAVYEPHDICGATCSGTCSGGPTEGATCSEDKDCQKGNDFSGRPWEGRTCGVVPAGLDAACIDPAQANTSTSANFVEGSTCLLRYTCVERDSCAPCEGNVDCTVGDANVCVSLFDQKSCVRFCETNTDCNPDHYCAPYFGLTGKTGTCDNAPSVDCDLAGGGAECGGGACAARSVCIPNSGACRVTPGAPTNFCQHCIQDSDCGAPGSGWVCAEVTIGEFACVDLATPCSSDADCPTSPSGKQGKCITEDLNEVDPTDPTFNRCFAPLDTVEGKFTCYP